MSSLGAMVRGGWVLCPLGLVWGWVMAFCVPKPVAATPGIPSVTDVTAEHPMPRVSPLEDRNLSPEMIEGSPLLQRWLEDIPDIWQAIDHDPSFPTRWRLGYVRLGDREGWSWGWEDVWLEDTGLTVSGMYEQMGEHDRTLGADLHYYLLPLGRSINLAPIAGYRYLAQDGNHYDGVNLGFRVLLVLSPGGGADVSIDQTWVALFSEDVVSLTTLRFAYALTHHLRLSTELQRQQEEGKIGIFLEWMPDQW